MVSRTKYLLDNKTVTRLFENAGITGVTSIAPLGAGEYNAVYAVKADKEYVLKVAPAADTPILTYEKEMMKSEVYWYSLLRTQTDIRVPEVYFADDSKTLIPTAYFIMEKLAGTQMDQFQMTAEEKTECSRRVAQMVAQLHQIQNTEFGYLQNGLHGNWYAALTSMLENLICDAERVGKKSPKGKKLLTYAKKYESILKDVPSTMVNYDAWMPNMLCRRLKNGEIEIAWIDPERSFWGDRIFDFICLEFPKPLSKKTLSVRAYNEVSGQPILCSREECIRFAFAEGVMALIQEVEKYYRYTPHHFGWWRNVLSAAMLYKQAFRTLERPQ